MVSSQEQKVLDLLDLMRHKSKTKSPLKLGFAESCTGGLLSSWVTQIPGVSDVYWGSVVSYSPEVKTRVLHVSDQTIQTEGVVSAATVKEMLLGVRQLLKVDCAAAITGIAGPTGGTAGCPIGAVFVAVSGPQFERVERWQFKGDRISIQMQACEKVIEILTEELRKL